MIPVSLDRDSLWLFITCTDGSTTVGRLAVCDDCGQMFLLDPTTEPAQISPAMRWAAVADLAGATGIEAA